MGGVCGSGEQTAESQGFARRRDTNDTIGTVDLASELREESDSDSVGYDPSDAIGARKKNKRRHSKSSSKTSNTVATTESPKKSKAKQKSTHKSQDSKGEKPKSVDNEDTKEQDFLLINNKNDNNNQTSNASDSVSNTNNNSNKNNSSNDNNGNNTSNDKNNIANDFGEQYLTRDKEETIDNSSQGNDSALIDNSNENNSNDALSSGNGKDEDSGSEADRDYSRSTIDRAALIAEQTKPIETPNASNASIKSNQTDDNNNHNSNNSNNSSKSKPANSSDKSKNEKNLIEDREMIGSLPNSIEAPQELQDVASMGTKGFEDDLIVMESLKAQFGTQFNSLKMESNTFERYVIGYRSIKDRNERIKTTAEHLNTYMRVHTQLDFDNILINPKTRYSTQEEMEGWPVCIYGQDKQGHILMWDEIGSVNVNKLDAAFRHKDFSCLQLHRARVMRRVENMKAQMQKKYNYKHLYKHSMIFDLKHFSLSKHGAKERRSMCQKVINEMENMYPECVNRIYVLNAPGAFRAFWQVLKLFMDPVTVDKVRVLGKNYLKELTKDIDISMIPPKYGGKGIWKLQYSRPPKGFPMNSLVGM